MTVSRRAALGLGGAVVLALSGLAGATSAAPAAPGDMSLGSPAAKIHVVEYLSLSCPHCAHFNETVFPAFKAKYIDTGKVRYTSRELLTAPANVAAAGFLMARCVAAKSGPSGYFAVVDQVLRSQSKWGQGSIKPIFLEIGRRNGLDPAQFDACVSDEKAQADLETRIRYAVETDKVEATPAFFVNGKAVVSDDVTLAVLDAAIADAAKRAAPASPAKRRR